jgi:hypothetical protein
MHLLDYTIRKADLLLEGLVAQNYPSPGLCESAYGL